MDNIKIFRLKNGQDIIGNLVVESHEVYCIDSPMSITILHDDRMGKEITIISEWLPISIIESNSVSLKTSDVMFVLNPTENFKFHYLNESKEMETIADLGNIDDEGQLMEINEAIMESLQMRENNRLN